MKKIFALVIACTLVTVALAKQAPSRDQRLVPQLNLTAEQKTKVDPILADAAKKLRDIRQDSAMSEADKRTRLSEVRKDTNAKLKEILTADQWKKLQELRGENKKEGGKKK